MKTAQEVILAFEPCEEAKTYISGKLTIEEMVRDCQRGDWMLRLAKDINIPLRPLTLAKALCAKTVFHLMKYEGSRNAVLVAERFGNGLADKDELAAAAADAADAFGGDYDFAADAAYSAADASTPYSAADAAYAAAEAAAYAATPYSAAAAAAKKENQLRTADICRETIGQLIIDEVKKLQNN